MKKYYVFPILVCIASAVSCQSASFKYEKPVKPGAWLKGISVPYDGPEGEFFVQVQIFFPEGFVKGEMIRSLILLPPRGKAVSEWERNSIARKLANQYKIALICPDTGKSVYETSFYPETADKWAPLPGGRWVAETLVPYMREQFALCRSRSDTGIAGIESGARGALLIAEKNPRLFGFAAGMSGLYDLSVINSSAYVNVYGSKKSFPERWSREDNVIALASELKNTAVYIVHGKRDEEVPVDHSQLLVIRLSQLKKQNSGVYNYKYAERNKPHKWDFWNSELPDLFLFMDQNIR
ncbi:MAG: alpha/beta hydrolase [Spirochaetota bacterium]